MSVQLWSYSRGRICGGNTVRTVLSWSSSYGRTPGVVFAGVIHYGRNPGVVFAGVIPLGSYCHERPAMVVFPESYLRG
ncbi:hypothetical protein J6590_079191 [Homalodisca vitripennis]|nr:hypothetical protein J6590_079191 [Homalodisca vitripennis]